jgi:1-acyl-sn-glycerol-3-phosphate acyltransferase
LRKFLKLFFALLFKLFARVEVIDKHYLPREGGGIVAGNHQGIVDAPLIFHVIDRQDITALVAKKHKKNPFLRWIVNGARGIWINREEADSQAVRAARDLLQSGGMLGIAPEGTRSKTGTLIPGKTGIAFLADKAGVPIIPIAITGTHRGVYRLLSFHRLHLSVRFGEPFYLPPISRKTRDQDLRSNTDEIMCRIGAMLPPELRGVYADHPRLNELIATENSPVEAASLFPE